MGNDEANPKDTGSSVFDAPAVNERHVLLALRQGLKDLKFRHDLAQILVQHFVEMLPVTPLFTLEAASRLVPAKMGTLRHWVRKLGIPKRYIHVGRAHRRYRMLYGFEIADIRKHVVHGDVSYAILMGPDWRAALAERRARDPKSTVGQ